MKRTLVAAAVTLSLLWGGSAVAQEPERPVAPRAVEQAKAASAEVLVLHATNDGEGIDDGIGKLPQLRKPPFSSYDTYKLLQRSQLRFSDTVLGELVLPNRATLQLQLVEQDDRRVVALVTIVSGDKKDKKILSAKFKAQKKRLFFIAGPKHGNGILVLGVRLDSA